MDLYILHAGISHPSPYFYNLEKELKQYPEINVIINPNLPTIPPRDKGIVYFNRLKRFVILQKVDILYAEIFI